jgi:uncharacterized protein
MDARLDAGPLSTPDVDLDTLVRRARSAPGLLAKAQIGLVADVLGGVDWLAGPGDDGAVVTDRGSHLVVGGEAIFPPFVAADPFGAGVAAVLANVNDLAAMGAIPLAIVDTVTAPESTAREVLAGMRWASELYDVPVVGGHLTVTGGMSAVSAFGLGRADALLAAGHAAPGQTLMVACCLDGRMREDFPFFPSFDERGARLAGDVRLLAEIARNGWAVAAKDISMAGLLGSLGMLLECTRLGVTVDLAALPVPAGVDLARWLECFPCYGFLLCVPDGAQAACADAFAGRGLTAAPVGTLDSTGLVRVAADGAVSTVFDLTREAVTNLRGAPPTAV